MPSQSSLCDLREHPRCADAIRVSAKSAKSAVKLLLPYPSLAKALGVARPFNGTTDCADVHGLHRSTEVGSSTITVNGSRKGEKDGEGREAKPQFFSPFSVLLALPAVVFFDSASRPRRATRPQRRVKDLHVTALGIMPGAQMHPMNPPHPPHAVIVVVVDEPRNLPAPLTLSSATRRRSHRSRRIDRPRTAREAGSVPRHAATARSGDATRAGR